MLTKEELERQHAQEMNAAAIEKIKAEVANDVNNKSEATWFEYGKVIKLLDGKEYALRPAKLKHGKRLMFLLSNISVDNVLINFINTGDAEADAQRIQYLYEALKIAFHNYPEVTEEYLDEYCDFAIVHDILEALIDMNGLKK
jgi:hypothetical protein